MKVVMLAAGTGSRLERRTSEDSPKILLRFNGKSLLQHHIEILRAHGVTELVIGVGHRRQEIEGQIAALGEQEFVRTVFNKEFAEGSVVTLWALREELCCASPVILMDADVLYDEEIFDRLVNSRHKNCLLLDRNFEAGDEPVKICVRSGEIVEFRKRVSAESDFVGESVGFFKFHPLEALKLISQAEHYMRDGPRPEPYEEAIRDVLLTSRPGTFAFEDVTGVPWIEIDYPEDVRRARDEILPSILSAQRERRAAMHIMEEVEATTRYLH